MQRAVLLLAALATGPAAAAVVASVDRNEVELNESFTLKVTVDTAIDVEPDATALEDDFYIGNRKQLSNTTIVNGRISRSRTWEYVLMAKREGRLTIPPVIVAGESSDPVEITVKPVSSQAPGEADIFITAEVDHEESYVQAQILYTLKVYRAVATRQPQLSEPEIAGVEVLVQETGDERSYDAILDGKAYIVVERVIALFPQESGTLEISPVRFQARVLRNGRITGRKVFRSEPVTVTVKPIPPPPASHPDAAWLPAQAVELSEEWSRETGELPAGEPITRHVTVTALGQLATQIPVVEPESSDELKVYPDKPELNVTPVAGGLRAERSEQYALIGVTPGAVELPPVELPWWDVAAGEWRVATLPGRSLTITRSADALPEQPAPPAGEEPAVETVTVVDPLWQRIAEGLALLWLLTVLAWWWSRRRPPRDPGTREPAPLPVHKQQSRLLKAARKAARDGDAAGVKAALFDWARLEWPAATPRSLGGIAARVAEPLAGELKTVSAARYGPGRAAFDGTALARALRSVSVTDKPPGERDADDGLPPLMPVGRSADSSAARS